MNPPTRQKLRNLVTEAFATGGEYTSRELCDELSDNFRQGLRAAQVASILNQLAGEGRVEVVDEYKGMKVWRSVQ